MPIDHFLKQWLKHSWDTQISQRILDAVLDHSDSSADFRHFRHLNIDVYLSAKAFKLLLQTVET